MSERFGQDLILLERLAAGGMAEVYRAKQIGYGGFEKTVAVKRILPNYASDEEFKGMFRQEANLSACLQHQSIVQVFGNGEHDGYLYLVMEFVDGKNVRQILSRCERKKKRIPIELSLFIVAETAKGLQYAHTYCDEKSGAPLNIVHRDMSPQNIMVGFDASVKIVDFGIAKAASWADNTRAGVLKGKFGYMSPEQARGEKLDGRTDIFALGIILFETLTQRRLFTSDDDLRTIKMVKECHVPRPSKYNPSITSQLDRIVLKALEKNKADRYQSAQELYEDLIVYLNQKFPKFVPTELSKFQKEIFKEDIEEFRRKREKQAAEAPAIVGAAKDVGRRVQTPALDDKDKTDASGLSEEKTQLSQSNSQMRNEEAPLPEGLEIPALVGNEIAIDAAEESRPEPGLVAANSESSSELSFTSSGLLKNPEPRVESSLPLKAAQFPTVKTNTELGEGEELQVLNSPRAMPIPPMSMPRKTSRLRLYLVAALVLIALAALIKQGAVSDPTVSVAITPDENSLPPKSTDPISAAPKLPEVVPSPEAVEPPPASAIASDVESNLATEGVVTPPTPPPGAVAVTPPPVPGVANDRPPAPLPHITLQQLQGPSGPYGRIRINTIPRTDEFYINGKLVVDERDAPIKIDGQDLLLPPGDFQVELRNLPFEKRWTGTLQIQADVRREKDIVLK